MASLPDHQAPDALQPAPHQVSLDGLVPHLCDHLTEPRILLVPLMQHLQKSGANTHGLCIFNTIAICTPCK